MIQFEAFPKIPRLKRGCVITEKIDGTNACVVITEDGEVAAQSRNKMITPDDDNYGFARWVHANKAGLIAELGIGRHFGEWWGAGIQRRYGLTEKRFSLFNAIRWKDAPLTLCGVVPILHSGEFTNDVIDAQIERLTKLGSVAAPGFMNPEGIVVFHVSSKQMFKVTCKGDESPKGLAA